MINNQKMQFSMDITSLGGIIKEIRRVSDPDKAQIIWDGIKTVRAQKQIPALPRLSRYMNRNYKLDKETTQRLLDLAVDDNLIKLHKKVGTKGNKAGVEEDAYRLPTEDMLPFERHDWYCFHCHAGGEVVLCRDCHRVYHQSCIKEELIEQLGFVCQYCRCFQAIPAEFNKEERRDLNHLLSTVVTRLKEKLSGHILTRSPPPPAKNPFLTSDRKATVGEGGIVNSADREAFASFGEEKWRAKFLLKRQIDLDEVYNKCVSIQYRTQEEFRSDVQNIVHNVAIYHGNHSAMADQAKQMFRACTTDLSEVTTCRDCYRYANTRGDKYWFAKPCRPFHQIIYAQQKGYPYWPAKVVGRVDDNNLEVRFFGGYHQRARVDKNDVKPISTNIHALQIKKTSAWNKASEELSRYQELHEKCKGNPEFLTNFYGDPFNGEKVSALIGDKFGAESDSESEEDQNQPGDPGTSLPPLDYNTTPLHQPILQPLSVIPRTSLLTPTSTPISRHQTKLRRIEPKPLTGGEQAQAATSLQQQQQQQTMMLPLAVVTVPQVGHQQLGMHGLQLGAQHLTPGQHLPQLTQQLPQQQQISNQQQLGPPNMTPLGPPPNMTPLGPPPNMTPLGPPPNMTPQHVPQYHNLTPQISQHQPMQHIQMQALSSPHTSTTSSYIQFDASISAHDDLLNIQASPQSVTLHSQPQPQQQHLQQQQQMQLPQLQQQQSNTQQQSQQIHIQNLPPISQVPMDTTPFFDLNKDNDKGMERLKVKEEITEEGEGEDAVSSSSQLTRFVSVSVQTPNKLLRMVAEEICGQNRGKPADKDYKEFAEKLRAEFEQEKKRAVNVATRSLERDLERLKADHTTELENLAEKNKTELSESKRKQWCYNCEAEAIYWCCWNTAYCSTDCQQSHWHREHKRMCRRKR